MTKITTLLSQYFAAERNNFILFSPVFIGFGAAFYFLFAENFTRYLSFCVALFALSFLFYLLSLRSSRSLVFLGCVLFLGGSFYGYFYQKTFLNYTKIERKIYVDVVGKVENIQKFTNPINGVTGANLLISQPKIYKAQFSEKAKIHKKKKLKKTKKKKAKVKTKKVRKPRAKKVEEISREDQVDNAEISTNTKEEGVLEEKKISDNSAIVTQENLSKNLSDEPIKKEKKLRKKKQKKPKKKKLISEKKILKSFVNLQGYMEIDRKFLDFSKAYQQVEWLKIKDRDTFANPPPKISVNLVKNAANIKVNDVIAFRSLLQPPKSREFLSDFDYNLDAKFKKIGAYGFVIGETKMLRQGEITKADDWFLKLREMIRTRINQVLQNDEAAIAQAFLIGDQSAISQAMMQNIRNSGLAHLLSISGFHLSLASAICFIASRFLLSRSEYLTLHFDLKKIAAIAAILGAYFYLKIAAGPLPAQRAFLIVLLTLSALFVGEKLNAKRAVMFAALCLIIVNPLAVFNISFQLTFAAILMLTILRYQDDRQDYLIYRIIQYFRHIILVSLAIQIATMPFLMHSFRNVSILGFVANFVAIPFTSFVVMPLGFLALFLMIFSWEKLVLILFAKSILVIEKIAQVVGEFAISNFVAPQISSWGVVLAIVGLLIFSLLQSRLRYFGFVIFALSFFNIKSVAHVDILFAKNQKFFAIKGNQGLIFSKNLPVSKQRQYWMKKMNETDFKTLKTHPQKMVFCDETFCEINAEKKFLVILQRQKISQICTKNFDVIVNLTRKYNLPDCVSESVIKVDNADFYQKGGQYFKYNGNLVIF